LSELLNTGTEQEIFKYKESILIYGGKMKMKYALTWPKKIVVKETEIPEIKDNEILVKIERAGICGTDMHVYESGYGPHRISGSAEYPLSLGHEYVGVIEKKGKNADKAMYYHTEIPEEGDRIFWGLDRYYGNTDFETILPGWQQWAFAATYGFSPFESGVIGAWSQYTVLKPQTHIFHLPKQKISVEEGVVIEPYIVGLRAVDKAFTMLAISEKEANPDNDLFLVQGAGAIGLATVVALRNSAPHSTIILTDPHDHRLEKGKELGANYTINVSNTTKEERIKIIKEIATSADRLKLGNAWGVDAAFECAGKNVDQVIPEGIDVLRPMGVYVDVGAFTFNTAGKFTLDPHELTSREVFFVSNWAYPLSTIIKGTIQVRNGLFKKLPYNTIITHEHSLEEIEEGIKQMTVGEGIKHTVNPWKEE
jgi:L-iditol 2-dehydrogenase